MAVLPREVLMDEQECAGHHQPEDALGGSGQRVGIGCNALQCPSWLSVTRFVDGIPT
jgi:hypothetical protein